VEKQGIEADDIIGTLAKKSEHRGVQTVIVSGDKDLMQLVSRDVIMIDTMKDKTYNVDGVREYLGVGPERVTELLGLAGDASDNIPGVPGVGIKTARKLIDEYGTMERILENAGKVKNARIRKNLEEFADQALLSRDLATIKTDVAMDFDIEAFRVRGPDLKKLREIFAECEFSSLIQALNIEEEATGRQIHLVFNEGELDDLLSKLLTAEELSFDLALSSEEAMKAEIVGIALCISPREAFYIPIGHDYDDVPKQLEKDTVLGALAPVLSDERIKKSSHDIKRSLIVFSREGVSLRGVRSDSMVAAYLLNPSQRSFDLSDIALKHLNRGLPSRKELTGSGAKAVPFAGIGIESAADYSCQRVMSVFRLAPVFDEEIKKGGFENLFSNVEMPLVAVLASMEEKGVLLDRVLLKELSHQFGELMETTEEEIYRLVGERFNVNSPKQLQVILFDKLGLPRGRKTKEGYSTDVEVLTNLARSHEVPARILTYRSFAKLRSTYVDALPLLIHPETGRVHTSYNQTVTATGRLSSSNPNLQNIPIKTMEGKRIRQAFIAPEGYELISADYSQIELRIMAHLSGDEFLINAFQAGEDIHRQTAAGIFAVFPEMVNDEMRRQAKVINFGIMYGMSPFGLSRELGITQKLAKIYIEEYFRKFKGVRRFIDNVLEDAREKGFVATLLNRKRYIPEIKSGNAPVRQFAERMAINTPIQGTAADLIKVAMINVYKKIKEKGFSTEMIMQVHDELVFEAPSEEKEEVMELIRKEMEGVITLSVPLTVDIKAGKNWDEAH
jgi:DNA polymerase-1